MSFWHKGTSWVRQNPDRAVPAGLVVIILLLVGGIFLLNNISSRPKVPTPFDIADPEKPALQVGGVEVPRRALYGLGEAGVRQGFLNSKVSFDGSALQFCQKRMENPGDMRGRVVSLCSGEMQRVAQFEAQLAEGVLMLAEARSRGWKPTSIQVDAAMKALLISLRRSVKAKTDAQALRSLGLTMDDIRLQAEISLAQDYFYEVREKPTRQDLEKQIEDNRELYARPRQMKPIVVASPTRQAAEQVYETLAPNTLPSQVESKVKPLGAKASVTSEEWVSVSEFPASLRSRLNQASLGEVLKPLWIDGLWVVTVAGDERPAAPLPPFSKIEKKVRDDWENNQRERNVRELEEDLSKWLPDSYCEKGAAEGVKLACGRGKPQ